MISIFELFSIGVGPSSSHTVGPMRAANDFVAQLPNGAIKRLEVELYGSLALTGKGHGTDRAIIVGLEGYQPDTVDPAFVYQRMNRLIQEKTLMIQNQIIDFEYQEHFIFKYTENLPYHTNGMRFIAYDTQNNIVHSEVYYSIGGGFIISDTALHSPNIIKEKGELPYYYETAQKLLEYCDQRKCTIAELVLENEKHWRSEDEIKEKLYEIWSVMDQAIDNGCKGKGLLPGDLKVRRRAPIHYQALLNQAEQNDITKKDFNWLNVYAMAVNEENAAGHRIVTAPTNGAAGIIPAVLKYFLHFYPKAKKEDVITYLLTAGGIAILYKKQASISGAEVGCQGEVGVACSMAAGALTAVLGGSIWQVEQAAEIGMEHHLGLTCDPILGLVQVPCIERNAMASIHAVNAAHIAMLEDGKHVVSLDQVIQTMKQTGADMHSKYKETAMGGLAVNVPVC
ncbi:MAG: L-serine ammonia-lyase [Candidatus Berkiella sp.]